jgi:hypothetical protein
MYPIQTVQHANEARILTHTKIIHYPTLTQENIHNTGNNALQDKPELCLS